jgi:hypothetical protein
MYKTKSPRPERRRSLDLDEFSPTSGDRSQPMQIILLRPLSRSFAFP